MLFQTIVADPPWQYGNSAAKGAAEKKYNTLPLNTIKGMPVLHLASENAHLYLWTTNAFLVSGESAEVARAWGFIPKTVITWEKTGRLGVGNYFRNSTEHIIFAVRGRLPTYGPHNVRTCFASAWIKHSRKPPWSYELIEKASPGPYLELFARDELNGQTQPDSWVRWGNQAANAAKIPMLDGYFMAEKHYAELE